jgi:citrate synthase
MPVLESAITLIDGGRLRYRGRDAVAWAQGATIEETAALLWDGEVPDAVPPVPMDWSWRIPDDGVRAVPLPESLHMFLAAAAVGDAGAYDLRPDAVRRTGARILRGLAAIAAGDPPPRHDVALDLAPVARMLRGLCAHGADSMRMIDTALSLCADHELNVSAFTARCIASAGATPYAAVGGALGALSGFKHGGQSALVRALFDEVHSGPGLGHGIGRDARAVIRERLRAGNRPPGFGHPLYPDGDPRATALLALARAHRADHPWLARAEEVREAAAEMLNEAPNLDFGLVTLAGVLGMPAHGPFVLFAVGRTVGWIAHILEQYAVDRMIRPRARYVGRG